MTAVLLLATVTSGWMAGLFWAYSVSVMPGLRGANDAVFVEAMQRINIAIQNGVFFLGFAGTALLGVAAVVLAAISGPRAVLVPAIVATALYLAQIVLTASLHIPLNNALDAAGRPGQTPDPAAARQNFETVWVRWNHVRTLLCTGALAAFGWALLQA